MARVLTILALCLLPLAVSANEETMRRGISAANAGNFEAARAAEAAIADPAMRDVVAWSRLRAYGGTFEEYVDFLERNGDWPGIALLRARGESTIPRGTDPAAVIAYFEGAVPRTGTGSLRLAEALRATGDAAAADAELGRAWSSMVMTAEERAAFLDRHGDVLEDYHLARLDHLLWENEVERARAMYPYVPEGYDLLGDARLALRARSGDVNARIARVPASLQDDPGLLYERFLWRMREGLWEGAAAMILEASTSAEALGRPAEWSDRRRSLARDYMRDGDFDLAYRIASSHFMEPAEDYSDFSDLEWLAGYTALRLGRPEQAAAHFETFRQAVFSPISVGRAGYWLGRAHEAAGNADAAAEAYALGAQYQSSFYGQLAAERGGIPTDPDFLGIEPYGDWRDAPFADHSVFRAGLALREAGLTTLSERFFTHLVELGDRRAAGRLGVMALEFGDPHLALSIAKRAAQQGWEIMAPYYPIADLFDMDLSAPLDFVLSIARRESEFDHDVQSGAGALGLMQVMPRTGQFAAQRLGLPYSSRRSLNDAEFNARLGAEYLNYLTGQFGNNPVLISAAYNAGPSRSVAWLERFGDFRTGDVDVVDWIEMVPFRETRNYIMRVTESLRIYEAQLTGQLPQRGLSEILVQR